MMKSSVTEDTTSSVKDRNLKKLHKYEQGFFADTAWVIGKNSMINKVNYSVISRKDLLTSGIKMIY